MKKGFSAKRDGFSSQNWHLKVDNKGKTLVIIKTKDNFIFGGFSQVGWTTDKSKWNEENRKYYFGSIIDPNAFIFSLRNDKSHRKPEKIIIKHPKNAIYYDYLYNGPFFGIRVYPDLALDHHLKSGYSNLGYSYYLPNRIEWNTNEAKSYLAGSYDSWEVDELETYFI
ncbi:hypothetical protein M0811_14118 [Anaeramoeba ignava]|uniref:TLDc domain-containing protein n=1 Tax=Anaeramoeba ignava TaxID=1746090 RepID=A0A9Q0LWU6_ANAIG|nr:hypothetical protein M0811_14118 [Anaeramoeba ignava]